MAETPFDACFSEQAGLMTLRGYLTARRFSRTVWLLALLITVVSICLAWEDKSWGALYIAFVGAPIVNGALLIGSQICLWILRSRNRSLPIGGPMMAAAFAPLASSTAVIVAVFSMSLHGC